VKLVDRDTVERLKGLLETERAAAATVSGLISMATTPAMDKLFEKLRDDEAWSCAGLTRVIKRLGGKASHDTADVAQKVQGRPSLRERLILLNRGQAGVVKRLDRLLEQELDRETGGFLRQMRSLHAENVHLCEELIMTLTPSGAGRGHRQGEGMQGGGDACSGAG
jgi:hypothetical protein